MNIAIYLGSAIKCDPQYNELAFHVGEALARNGHTVVYGGADVGTMKYLADGAQSAGGKVIGVFPKSFQGTKEVRENGIKIIRDNLDEMIYTSDFAERKKIMEKKSDCCLVLPGSFGTLDELFTFACGAAIGEHHKKIYILNHKDFYTPLKELMDNVRKARFLKEETIDMLVFCNTIEEMLAEVA